MLELLLDYGGYREIPFCMQHALTVLAMSMAIVIGPTPPGMGVINDAF
jgi:hypothetical protein